MIPGANTSLRSARRERLARLREEAEPLVAEERRTALRILLQHPLLTPEETLADAFMLVRRHREYAADWFAHHAGWSLTAAADVIRLRKFPADTGDPTRGAIEPRSEEPFTRTRYVLFCLALAAIERGDLQTTLDRLAHEIVGALAGDPAFADASFSWSLDTAAGRRDFVHALRLLLHLGVLRRVQGDEERYRLYARVALRRRAAAVRSAHSATEDAQRHLRDAERRAVEAESVLRALTDEQAARDRDLAAAEEAERALRSSPEMRTADALDQAARAAQEARAALAIAQADEASATRSAALARQRLAEIEQQLAGLERTTDQSLHATEALAHDADLLEAHRSRVPAPPVHGWPDAHQATNAADALNLTVQRRRQAIALLRMRETEAAAARRSMELAENLRCEADAACSTARENETLRRQALDKAGVLLQAAYRTWHSSLRVLLCPTADELAEDFAGWLSRREGPSPLQGAAGAAHREVIARLAGEDENLRMRLEIESVALEQQRRDLTALEQGATPRPAPPPTRRADRADRPGAPLWRLCDFVSTLADGDRPGIESALEASGLLDAWLMPDGRLLAADTEDTFLLSGATPITDGCNLAEALVPAIDASDPGAVAVGSDTVMRLLRAVGFGHEQGDHWVATDGAWRLGPVSGRWFKPVAEFIGESTRAQTRRRRIAELRDQIVQAERRCSEIAAARAAAMARGAEAESEIAALPADGPVFQADFALVAAVRAVAETFTAHEKAEREAARTRLAFEDASRRRDTDAADCGLLSWLGRLELLDQAVANYAEALAGLWPTLRHLESEILQTGHARKTSEAAAQECVHRASRRQEADEAEAAAASRHRTLQQTHGATVEAVLLTLHQTEAAIRALRDASKANQREQLARTSARDTAERDHVHADEERRRHEESRAIAVASLQRFAEQRLFAEADEALAGIEPAGWSITRAIEVARAIEPALANTPADDESWRQRQDTIHGHIQELRDRLVAQGHQPESHSLEDFVLVRCVFQTRPHSMNELRAAFADEVRERERLLAAKEKEIIENHLLGEVAVELQKLIRDAEEWIKSANAELAARPTSTGLRFRFVWETIDEGGFPAVRRTFLRTSELWSPAERSGLSQFLQNRIRASQASDEDGSWRDHLSIALDYRHWHRFVVERQQDGQWRRLDRRTYGTASGGEKALALTLPRFAAAAAYYKSAAAHAPRLVMLDEAFAGIDPTMRAQCLGVLEQFDLDVVMTSELEWGCYPTVPGLAIYHLSTFPGVDAVGVTRWVWNGHERSRRENLLPPDRPPTRAVENGTGINCGAPATPMTVSEPPAAGKAISGSTESQPEASPPTSHD